MWGRECGKKSGRQGKAGHRTLGGRRRGGHPPGSGRGPGQSSHDSPLLEPTLGALETLGVPEWASVHLDRGYDSKATRRLLEDRGLVGVISLRRTSRPLLGPRNGGSWRGPTRGATPTRSLYGAPRGKN